jgi:FKBP-type peptidyl-prolyl cis-trans isomerase
MFPFKKKKKRQQNPTPTWLMLLIAAFVAYAVFTGDKNTPSQNDNKPGETGTAEPSAITAQAPADKPAEASILGIETDKILNIDVLKDKFTPKSIMKLSVTDNTEGTGQFAVCGQKVTISYSSFTEDKNEIESKQTASFQIGENKVMPALELGVIGMKKNGERTISSPPNMAYGAENFQRNDFASANVNFEVQLLDVSPELPEIGAYRILGDGKGQDQGYLCGSQVKLHVTLWDIEGKKLYSSRDNNGSPISFTIGKSEVFLGLEQGVLDMLPGMRRNLIVPPAFQKTLLGNAPAINFPLPKNQTVLVDVESVF